MITLFLHNIRAILNPRSRDVGLLRSLSKTERTAFLQERAEMCENAVARAIKMHAERHVYNVYRVKD